VSKLIQITKKRFEVDKSEYLKSNVRSKHEFEENNDKNVASNGANQTNIYVKTVF